MHAPAAPVAPEIVSQSRPAADPSPLRARDAAARDELAAINAHLNVEDARARRLLRMSVLLLTDADPRSRAASERYMAEAFACGAQAVDAYLARAEIGGTISAVHLGTDGSYGPCPFGARLGGNGR